MHETFMLDEDPGDLWTVKTFSFSVDEFLEMKVKVSHGLYVNRCVNLPKIQGLYFVPTKILR